MKTLQVKTVFITHKHVAKAPVAFPEAESSIRGFIRSYKFYRPPVPLSVLSFIRHDPIGKFFFSSIVLIWTVSNNS